MTKVQLLSVESGGNAIDEEEDEDDEDDERWQRYAVRVEEIVKRQGVSLQRVRYGKMLLWVPRDDAACGCPLMRVGQSYLLAGVESSLVPNERPGLTFNKHTIVMPWTDQLSSRLEHLARRELQGYCTRRVKPTKMPDYV